MTNEMSWFLEALLDNTSPIWTGIAVVCGILVAVFIIEYLKHEILKIRYERQRISLRKRFRHQNSGVSKSNARGSNGKRL